jgi:hypothetical protein
MPTLSDRLVPEGALVPVLIGLSLTQIQLLRKALQPIPAPIVALALIDTGAEMTGIDSSFVTSLGLQPKSSTLANLPAHGGMTLAFKYEVGFTICPASATSGPQVPILSVLDLPLAAIGYQVVLGRDVLARCRFLYDGPGNCFEFTY